jgi:hypothetical protein
MAVTAREVRPFDPKQPFSRAEARAAGISLKTLLSSRFHKVFYDCYVLSTVAFTRLRAKAALSISPPGSYVSHATAARLWGGLVPDTPDVQMTVPGAIGRSLRQASSGAVRYVRDGVDSAMETRFACCSYWPVSRYLRVNFILRFSDGAWWMRFDMCYPALKLIIEYDGRQHAEDSEQWLHDLKRREALDRMGWRIIVVTRDDFYNAPEEVLRRVRDALLDRGMAGLRRKFKTEWTRHIIGT